MSGATHGRFEGTVHVLPIRIYYEDTDLSGVVYHANYLRYMERGRSEFFRSVGIVRLAQLEGPVAIAWTLRKVEVEYVRPARLDDLIEVHTRALALTGARMSAEQNIFCRDVLLTRGRVEACMMTLDGRPRRIPRETRDKFAPFLNEETINHSRPNSDKVKWPLESDDSRKWSRPGRRSARPERGSER